MIKDVAGEPNLGPPNLLNHTMEIAYRLTYPEIIEGDHVMYVCMYVCMYVGVYIHIYCVYGLHCIA